MAQRYSIYASLILLFVVTSCDYFRKKNQQLGSIDDEYVARVNDQYLYKEDISKILGKSYSKEDSIDISKRYINNWIRKQLMLWKASTIVDADDMSIEEKIEQYKNTLILHEYHKKYLEENLDTTITEEAIVQYYQNNLNEFSLKETIFQGFYIKLPMNSPQISKVKLLSNSNNPRDIEELKSYALRFASFHILDESTWFNLDEVLTEKSVFNQQKTMLDISSKGKLFESQDKEYLYILKIKDIRLATETAPLSYIREEVKNILLNKKKVALVKNLEEKIYKEAENEKLFEIYQ